MVSHKGGFAIQLTDRQEHIMKIVKEQGPIKGEEIADNLGIVRATIRPDLAFLTKTGLLEARPRVGYYYKGFSSRISDEVKKMKVKDLKAVPAVVNDNATVYEAIVNLFVLDVGSLFIVSDGGLLEGVVSRKDLLKIALGQVDIHKVPITVVMTRMPNLITAMPEDSLWSAAKKLVDHEIDTIPVVREVNHEGREGMQVIGRITKTTITKAFVELGMEESFLQGGEKS